jgi:hypothetical protein
MVRKTQIKKKKSKSQLRKTKKVNLKHYSKTNKKGGKSRGKVHEAPFVPNPFSYKNERKRTNPLYVLNNKNNNNNNNLANGFVRNNSGLYDNSETTYNNSQSLFSGKSNSGSSTGYISLGYQTSENNKTNPLYTQMNPIYNDLSLNPTVGEAKLRKKLNNGNLLNGTAHA